MSDFAKFVGRFVYSKNSDYSEPEFDTKSILCALTPDESIYRKVEVDTGGNTIDMDLFTGTATGLLVYNSDATNFVTLVLTSGGACDIDIQPGGFVILANCSFDETATYSLTADTSPCICYIAQVGT